MQTVLSRTPGGHRLNYLLSRYVSGQVPPTEATFRRDVEFAAQYLAAFRKHGARPIEEGAFYEFGAGWNLIAPLTFYSMGANRQRVVDLRRLLRPELVALTVERLNRLAERSEGLRLLHGFDGPLRERSLGKVMHDNCGIDYSAPFDARNTGWTSGSVDYITATKVLANIPEPDLRKIITECHRILRHDGLAAFVVDYRDHYAYTDSSIGPYNFLQFSDEEWRRWNPGLHYQNRLRRSDYMAVFDQAGFEIVEQVDAKPDTAILASLDRLHLSPRFASYDLEEIRVVRSDFVLRKKHTSAESGA